MKKVFLVTLIIVSFLVILVLPCQKTFSAGQVTYWICGQCGQKAKTLKGWRPKAEVYDRSYCNGLLPIHLHLWEEVDYQTWINW